MRPLGALPALNARTSLPSFFAQWLSMPSLRTLRAELWVQRMRTLVVIARSSEGVSRNSCRGAASAAGRRGLGRRHGDADRLAACRRGAAGGSGLALRLPLA